MLKLLLLLLLLSLSSPLSLLLLLLKKLVSHIPKSFHVLEIKIYNGLFVSTARSFNKAHG